MPRQPTSEMITAPRLGANAGTSVNTIITNDINCAIWRPAYRSRMIAIATTRGPAAPMPCSTRAASNISSDPASIASRDATM